MKYRKKPVVIEAEQFTEEMALACLMKEREGPFGLGVTGHWHPKTRVLYSAQVYIETLEGTMKAEIGDFIIKGVKGELYPCKPDIFKTTYDAENGLQQDAKGPTMTNDEAKVYESELNDPDNRDLTPEQVQFFKQYFNPNHSIHIGNLERALVEAKGRIKQIASDSRIEFNKYRQQLAASEAARKELVEVLASADRLLAETRGFRAFEDDQTIKQIKKALDAKGVK